MDKVVYSINLSDREVDVVRTMNQRLPGENLDDHPVPTMDDTVITGSTVEGCGLGHLQIERRGCLMIRRQIVATVIAISAILNDDALGVLSVGGMESDLDLIE